LLSRRLQALAAAAAVFGGLLGLRLVGALEPMELAAHDGALRARPAAPLDRRLVIIDETEDDLARFGHPLSDRILARAIGRALDLGVQFVGVDKFRDIPVPPGTGELERLLARSPRVLWGYQFGGNGVRRIPPPRALAAGAQTGFIDVIVDRGGVVRRALLYLDDGGTPQPSLALRLALAHLAPQGIAPRPDPSDPDLLRLGRAVLPPLERNDGGYAGTDAAGYQVLLDYGGAPARFASVTLGELLDGKADARLLAGRIAILGSSAESLKDYFHTPFSAADGELITGAELQAHQVSQLVRYALGEARPVRTLPEALEVLLLALACVAGLGAWLASRASWLALLIAAGIALLVAAWLACAAAAVWFPVVPVAAGFLLTASVSAGQRALREARERAELMAIFARHVAPDVAHELWERREELGGNFAAPRRLEATVLFADIHGYSTVAELLTPEALAPWLNEFIAPLADAIVAHRGVIRQYVGDAVMAVFGAPIPSTSREQLDRDARTALACALEMRRRLAAVNARMRAAGRPTAGLRIGLHSGPMVGCNIGTRERVEYAVVGDAVNVAARVQSLPLPYADEGDAGRILLSGETRALLGEAALEALGTFTVKGRAQPVEVFRAA
jgi:adenylate cyclase